MHLNTDGLMNTSLTERGGLPLLAAWLAGASVCAVFALIACFALPVVFSAQGGQIFNWVWRPDTHEFGILPMIVGSLLLSVSALLLSWPLAVGVACTIQDGGKNHLFGGTVAGIIRFMTTIPTVVYGFAAVFLLVPIVREAAGKGSGLCWLSAALMLALLILPTMVLVMDSAMRTKEKDVRITAAALGFTRSQTLACLVLPASRRWLLTAAILGFGRAVGDTLIPLMLTGNAPHVPKSLFGSLRTLTAHMGLVTATEVGGPAYNSLFVAGGLLLAVYAMLGHAGALTGAAVPGLATGAEVLTVLAERLFGKAGLVLLAAIFMLACFNTCVGLIACVGEYFHTLLPRIPYPALAVFFAAASMLIANLGLAEILRLSVPVLNALYPVAIVLIALSFVPGLEQRRRVYPLCIGCTAVQSIAAALPLGALSALANALPLAALGFGWVLPAAAGLLAGILLSRTEK